jgi:hypothetical protein
MEETLSVLERKLKGLRLCYLVLGSILLTFGLLLVGSAIFFYYQTYDTNSLFFLIVAFYAPISLSSGFLCVVTYYGLRRRLRFARFTGIAGCLAMLGIFVIDSLNSLSNTIYYFNLASTVTMILILLVPVLLLLYTVLMWNEIQGDARLQPRTKKIAAVVIIAVVVLAVLIVVLPEVNKKLALGSLKYTDYDLGFGFNPPEGWTIQGLGSIDCFPPRGMNASEEVSLRVSIPIGPTYDIWHTTEEMKEAYRAMLSRWSNQSANFSLVSQHSRTLNGVDAYEFVYTYNETPNNVTVPPMKEKTILFARHNKGYMIIYQGLESLYSTYDDVAEQSINSMRFL